MFGTTVGAAAPAVSVQPALDPFQRSQYEAGDYVRWFVEHAFVLVPAQALVAQHLMSFQQFPPRQKPGSFLASKLWKNSETRRRAISRDRAFY